MIELARKIYSVWEIRINGIFTEVQRLTILTKGAIARLS